MFNTESVPSNISYKSFKMLDLPMQNSNCYRKNVGSVIQLLCRVLKRLRLYSLLFFSVRRSYDTNPEVNNYSEESNSNAEQTNPETGDTNSPDYSQVKQPTEEELQAVPQGMDLPQGMGLPQSAQGMNVPASILSGGSRRAQVSRLPKGMWLVPLPRNG